MSPLLMPSPKRRRMMGRRDVERHVRGVAVDWSRRVNRCCIAVAGRGAMIRRREEVGEQRVDVLGGRGQDEAFEDPVGAHFPPKGRLRICRRVVDVVGGRRPRGVHGATTAATKMDRNRTRHTEKRR